MTIEPEKMRIKAICVYPIKSLRGCTPPSLTAGPTGFSYDRRFMIQRVSDNKNMSIGKIYEMCLFTTELSPVESPDKILVRYTLDHVFNQEDEKVKADEVLEVPLLPDWKADGLKERWVDMHGSPTYGYEMADKYNEWFSKRFGYAVRILYVGDNRRKVLGAVTPDVETLFANAVPQQNNANNQGWLGAAKASIGSLVGNVMTYGSSGSTQPHGQSKGIDQGIGFADVAPFLVVSQKSYENAAARITGEELDVYKFRPNIIIEGADKEFDEDYWAEVAIGGNDDALNDTRIVLTSNCARCPSLNVDFDTGKQGQTEAGKILKFLSKDRRVDPGMKYSPIFGRYGFLARPLTSAGDDEGEDHREVEIRVGDPVRILRRHDERTRFYWPGISTDK